MYQRKSTGLILVSNLKEEVCLIEYIWKTKSIIFLSLNGKNYITNYWLLGINDFNGKFQLRVIELRGQSYPNLVP
jgi:hypothetical protein